jgi:photosystem II stability/assembly factor-like uncharacterized protein
MRATLAALALTLVAVASCAARSSAGPAPAVSYTEGTGTASTLYDIGCLSVSRCFAVGALSAGDGGTLLATTDGGRTWHREASPSRAPLYRIACAPPASCYVIARPGTVLVTHDAGAHWAVRALAVHVPGLALPGCLIGDGKAPQADTACRLGLLDISCPSARTCYTVGAGGVILRTTNGTRFAPVKTPARKNLNGITCVTASVCYAVGAAGTIETLHDI